MHVPTPTREQIGVTYCRLMEEILIRDELLQNVLNLGLAHGPAMALQPEKLTDAKVEFAYLQLRMICELIALGCLAAHGDIEGARTAKLRRSYEADGILKALEKLHPDFYPKPSRQSHDRDAKGIWRLEPIKSGFLTKQELFRLYGECGRFLHRGNLQALLVSGANIPDPAQPIQWAERDPGSYSNTTRFKPSITTSN